MEIELFNLNSNLSDLERQFKIKNWDNLDVLERMEKNNVVDMINEVK